MAVISGGLMSATFSLVNAFSTNFIVLLVTRVLVGMTVMPPLSMGFMLGECSAEALPYLYF